MKKTSLTFVFITLLSLTSCNPFTYEKKNAFYTDKMLDSYHIKGLPAIEYEYSYITKKKCILSNILLLYFVYYKFFFI